MKILIIDDDEVDYMMAARQLDKAFPGKKIDVDWIKNSRKIDYLSLFSPYDACLIDQNLGEHQGLDIIRNMHRSGCMVPMILLTGHNSEKVDYQATEFGATDYLVKDQITPILLNRSIRFAIAQKKHEKKLIELAYIDGLTRIANRKKFDEFMENSLSSFSRTKTPIGLILIDLDDFKAVNDTYGHQIGDFILKEVASRLQISVRTTDLVARLGGDEFAIIVTLLNRESDMEIILSKIRRIFTKAFQLEDLCLTISASLGVISQQPDEHIDFQEFFKRADLSLYSAKFKGKNMMKPYNKLPFSKSIQKDKLSSRIQFALGHKEFEVFYQPKINIADHTVCGTEALIRWYPKNNSLILPNDFIPAAEQSGDIVPIGEWVLDTACAQIKAWQDQHGILIPVAVNVSPVQICRASMVTLIRNTLEKYALPAKALEIEITETATLSNSSLLVSHLTQIHEMGCKITIDDFGVGYSSFQRFLEFPVSSLKIDRSFVSQIGLSKKADATCKSIANLANSLGIAVIAEGIETLKQMDAMEKLECKLAQGFYIKEPIAADHFIGWLSEYQSSQASITKH